MAMTEADFWNAIDSHFGDIKGDRNEQLEQLGEWLGTCELPDVMEFQRRLNEVMARAYTWNLIGAACFLGCGQSDDGFEDFRAWLIALGKETFERVLADVSVLATLSYDESPTEEWYFEELHLLPGEVGGEEEGGDWPYCVDPDTPSGNAIEITRAALREGFPVLWEHFGAEFMIGID